MSENVDVAEAHGIYFSAIGGVVKDPINPSPAVKLATRGTSCHYLSGNTADPNGSNPDESNGNQAADMDCSPVIVTSSVGNSAEHADVTPAWSSQVPLWPLPFVDGDMNVQSSASPDMVTFAEVNRILGIADSDNSTPTSTSQQSVSRSMSNWLPNANNLITTSTTMSESTPEDSVASLGGLDITSAPANYPSIPPYNPWTPVQLLGQYPMLLLYDDFSSPFIHRAMYNEQVSDMTTLPRTSMAICCGGGIRSNDSTRYIKRAIDAERRNLIEDFPTHKCMEQWDTLHAMLVYEILELREAYEGFPDCSRPKPRGKCLQLPFVLKMTQCFAKSYPEIRNPDPRVFFDDAATMDSPGKSSWNKWMITETARRTIFLAHIVNFFCNRDLKSAQQSPYYEPLDNDLIVNMPLPCSHKLWSARTEDEWTRLIMQQNEASTSARDSIFGFDHPPPEFPGLGISQPTVRSLLSNVTKDHLHMNASQSVGFSDSDELRRFFILCVLEQVD